MPLPCVVLSLVVVAIAFTSLMEVTLAGPSDTERPFRWRRLGTPDGDPQASTHRHAVRDTVGSRSKHAISGSLHGAAATLSSPHCAPQFAHLELRLPQA